MLDWLIIGGGVHGTSLAISLLRSGRVSPEALRILDPEPEPLSVFFRCAAACGMSYLRSPGVHHLDSEPYSLRHFAGSKLGRSLRPAFRMPYERPTLALFRAHVEHLAQRHRLQELWLPGLATGLTLVPGGYGVETDRGRLTARRVLLALGMSAQPSIPAWAQALRAQGHPVPHLFEPGVVRRAAAEGLTVVLGGGLSAAQAALRLMEEAPGRVALLSRHPLRVHAFDSDPGWQGSFLPAFRREGDLARRRAIIQRARHRGSLPQEVARAVGRAVQQGQLRHLQDQVEGAEASGSGITLRLQRGGALTAARLYLATGFRPERPGGAFLDRAIAELGLRCASCGYPVVDPVLQWRPALHVTGPLAELELGPVARNIVGAQLSAARLAQAL
jgi:thioredoxin reductase